MSKTLYIVSDGTLKRRHNTLLMEHKDEESRYIPVETLEEIMVMGDEARKLQKHIAEGAPYEPFEHVGA